jgi:hypothetical protein
MPDFTARYTTPDGRAHTKRVTAPSREEAIGVIEGLVHGAAVTALEDLTPPPPPPPPPPPRVVASAPEPGDRLAPGLRWCEVCQRVITPQRYNSHLTSGAILVVAGLVLIPCTVGLSLLLSLAGLAEWLYGEFVQASRCPNCNAKRGYLWTQRPTPARTDTPATRATSPTDTAPAHPTPPPRT